VAGAICFTSSTCFANPAVTISRIFTGTLTGIAPASVPGFIIAQMIGAVLAVVIFGWLFRTAGVSDKTVARLEELVKR
jgi:glycerol uptake facilitator-like aquaporin